MIFSITKVEINTSNTLSKSLKLHFNYVGEKRKITVRVCETFFDVGKRIVGGQIEVYDGFNFWVSDNFNGGNFFKISNIIKIEFLDVETNEVLQSLTCNIGNYNYLTRSLGGNISKKNIWIIGDSNVHHYFNLYDLNHTDLSVNKGIIIPIDIPELSINRFVNRNNIDFLESLPINSGDDIIFILGEIDCRVGFHRNSNLKKNNIIDQVNDVIDRYIDNLLKIKKVYKDTNVMMSLPNPAIKDGWIVDRKDLIYETNQNDRLFIRSYFEKYILKKCSENNIVCLNLTKGFENEIGFIKDDILYENDTHNKPTDIVFNNLKKHYNFTK